MDLLDAAIEKEILPRLRSAQLHHPAVSAASMNVPTPEDVAAFVELIIADDMEQVRAEADRVIVLYGGRDALLHQLLAPAARLLGEMWEQDSCDFMTVTLGVYRLDQIMKETATAGGDYPLQNFDHRVLLVPAPGEQHSFGIGMVADAFREGGWCVRSGPAVSRTQLLRLVSNEWFDVVGVSVCAERALKGLSSCIRAIRRASCNGQVFVMVGGAAFINHPERTRFLGADSSPATAQDALAAANIFVETTMTDTLRWNNARLVDSR